MKELKKDIKKLLELIEHNRTDLWVDNLDFTTHCIMMESINSKQMRCEDDYLEITDNKHQDNYQFTGDEIEQLIKKIKTNLNI